jgi:hypothetical protein
MNLALLRTAAAIPDASGQMFRMEQVIQRQDDDHETKDQYFTPAGGAAAKWLAKRYSYTQALTCGVGTVGWQCVRP